MRVVFVLSYPAYYTVRDRDEWLRWDNRDRRMPAILAEMGVEVELWGVGREAATLVSDAGFGAPYMIRLFQVSNPDAAPRDHYSDAMVAAARDDAADLFVVIGTNGGAGYRLFDRALKPARRRMAVIIGGDYWSRLVPHAALVFTESHRQEMALERPGLRFWRRAIPRARMERLPKTIDTTRFRPLAAANRWDVLAVSRLVKWKSFDEIGALSVDHRVAVAGGGPEAAALAARYPEVEWLGHVPNGRVPELLAATKVYFHAGRRDYFPRAIAEAMACGRPVVAFAGRVSEDVVPTDCGVLVTDRDYRAKVDALLGDPTRVAAMGAVARLHAVETHGPRSSEAACETIVRLVRGDA
jgi:glycosyltransferase involved in cell wall biosynthesis